MENIKQVQQNHQNTPAEPASSGIDLLPAMAEREIRSGVYKRKANVITLVALGFIGVLIVGILIFQGALALEANSVKNKTADAETRIRENQEVEIKALATKEKLDKIK